MPRSSLRPGRLPSIRAAGGAGSVMHLQCPACGEEELFIGVPAFDQRVSCSGCGSSAEVRHAHERWCAARRAELVRMFPELRCPHDE